jgi:hypothetical protein
VDINPNPSLPSDPLSGDLVVDNTSASELFGVVLQLRFPQFLNTMNNGLISDGGFCPGTSCTAGELITWDLGILQPGGQTFVNLSPTVSGSTPEGTLIPFEAAVSEDGGSQISSKDAVLIGLIAEQIPPVAVYVEQTQNCGGHFPCEAFVQDGLDYPAPEAAVIKAALGNYSESVVFDEHKTAVLQCGWNSDFSSRQTNVPCAIGGVNGATAIDGSLTIQNGTIILE